MNNYSLQKVHQEYLYAADVLQRFDKAPRREKDRILTNPNMADQLIMLSEFVQFCRDHEIDKTIPKAD